MRYEGGILGQESAAWRTTSKRAVRLLFVIDYHGRDFEAASVDQGWVITSIEKSYQVGNFEDAIVTQVDNAQL